MRVALALFAAAIIAGSSIESHAQSTAGAGSVIVVPVLAQTASYTSEVTVRNPSSQPITVDVKFYEAVNSSTPGVAVCSQLTVAANESKPFTTAGQCPALATGNHFGLLVLEDAASEKTHLFYAYSRTQTPGGNGFSVEGFPIGTFSGAPADVLGLKRQAAAPVYQTNCFVAALGEALSYQIVLRKGSDNSVLGNPISDSLLPFEMRRYLDIFSAAPNGVGAPAGDYSNIRANFTVTSGNQALVAFCTVQESTFFGADFRIAKSQDSLNNAQRRLACVGQDSCGVGNPVSATQPESLDATARSVYSMIVAQPDYLRCDLVAAAADLGNLKMRLRGPGDPFDNIIFPAGGAPFQNDGAHTFFYVYTGARGSIGGGVATRWFIDVETINNAVPGTIDFGITCSSGNGTEVPWLRGTSARY